jgi:hypothetical protein
MRAGRSHHGDAIGPEVSGNPTSHPPNGIAPPSPNQARDEDKKGWNDQFEEEQAHGLANTLERSVFFGRKDPLLTAYPV